MALYCSREIFEALDGVRFPARKDDLLDLAKLKDASEAVIVVLNELEDRIYHEISEVWENARVVCNHEVVRTLCHAPFPAKREDLIKWASRYDVPPSVIHALEALPSGYTFENLDEMCEYVL